MSATPAPDGYQPDSLIEGVARVTSVDGGTAFLETERKPACGGCASSGSCGVSSLAGVFGRKVVRLALPNSFHAVPGELVVIGVPQSAVLRASLLAYLLPVATTVIGAVLGAGGGDAAAAVGAGLGLGTGLLAAHLAGRRAPSGDRLKPVYLRRALAPPPEEGCSL